MTEKRPKQQQTNKKSLHLDHQQQEETIKKPRQQQQQQQESLSRFAHCPCCSLSVPLHLINSHLNACLPNTSSSHSPLASTCVQKPKASVATDGKGTNIKTEGAKRCLSISVQKVELNDKSSVEPKKEQAINDPLRSFPIFLRPKKVVHLIRHGHTSYSASVEFSAAPLRRHLFDVQLSQLGTKQASDLGPKLVALKPDVIITSPLTRALQTLKWAGQTSKVLASEFPWLSFSDLEDIWWFSPKHAPNDPITGTFQSTESLENLRKRVTVFRQFLLDREEQVVAVIGHSTFFKVLLDRRERMSNCQIISIKM
ncbi:hypothetical protein O6H91_18G083500 [Diphasiastrum complanatum]|uniref:Uncharacterized protein n=1 Tax=Diphasiastrum complanatum TaxID=34168 RepID=A0ACC2B3E6_DIPCM|nr:hypothetical protein O6H91_Y424700 [Diphasiastrum complanatum]KAJ7524255.1 hypothetical protein O6H91_18G083500 [Diphasiastrum complanatum]